jgi:trigger factor
VTDEFATTVGDYADLAELRSKIRQSLEGQAKSECDYEYSEKILSELVNSATIQYPPQMVEEQIDNSIKRLENRLANQKMDLPTYLKTRKMDTAALREELKPQAEASLKRTLVLYEVADSEKIQLGREDIANEMTQAMENYSRFMDPKQLQKLGKDKGFVENLARQTSVDLITQRTFERLQAIAKGELEAAAKAEETAPAEEATLPTATPESTESSPESGHETPAEKAAE